MVVTLFVTSGNNTVGLQKNAINAITSQLTKRPSPIGSTMMNIQILLNLVTF